MTSLAHGPLVRAGLFAAIFLALGGLVTHLALHGFVDMAGLRRTAEALTILQADRATPGGLALAYPQLPVYGMAASSLLPGLKPLYLDQIMACLLVAAVAADWLVRLDAAARHRGWALVIAVAMLANPLLLWSATAGLAWGFALFYLLIRAIIQLARAMDVQSQIAVGFCFALFALSDTRLPYLLPILIPVLIAVGDPRMVARAPGSFLAVLLFPMAAAMFGFLYVNTIFDRGPLAFLDAASAPLRGAYGRILEMPWLVDHGGEILSPLALSGAMVLLCFPALLQAGWMLRRQRLVLGPALLCLLAVPVGAAIGTFFFYPEHPALFVALAAAPLLVLIPPLVERTRGRLLLLALLLAGDAGSWLALGWQPSPEMTGWTAAVRRAGPDPLAQDRMMAGFLDLEATDTLLDERSAAAIIALRGNAADLLTSRSDAFKLAMLARRLDVPQVAVPNPAGSVGAIDRVNQNFSTLYAAGWPGYRLVFDRGGWRVYRRNEDVP